MPSVIEDHPQRQLIIDALLAGEATRNIVARLDPPVSFPTLHRYRVSVLGPALKLAHSKLLQKQLQQPLDSAPPVSCGSALRSIQSETRVATRVANAAEPLIARLAVKQQRREKWLQVADRKEDIRGFVGIDQSETRDIELEARLTGVLETAPSSNGPQVVVVINNHAAPAVAEEMAVNSAITIDTRAEK